MNRHVIAGDTPTFLLSYGETKLYKCYFHLPCMAGIAVSTRNLVKVYGGSVRALDDVSINVNRGEVLQY